MRELTGSQPMSPVCLRCQHQGHALSMGGSILCVSWVQQLFSREKFQLSWLSHSVLALRSCSCSSLLLLGWFFLFCTASWCYMWLLSLSSLCQKGSQPFSFAVLKQDKHKKKCQHACLCLGNCVRKTITISVKFRQHSSELHLVSLWLVIGQTHSCHFCSDFVHEAMVLTRMSKLAGNRPAHMFGINVQFRLKAQQICFVPARMCSNIWY